jgi:hypothetical protein
MPIVNPDSSPDPLLLYQQTTSRQNPFRPRTLMEDGKNTRQAKEKLAKQKSTPSHSMQVHSLQNGHQYGEEVLDTDPIESFTDGPTNSETNGKRPAKFTPNGTPMPDINEKKKIFEAQPPPPRLDLTKVQVKKSMKGKNSKVWQYVFVCNSNANNIIIPSRIPYKRML